MTREDGRPERQQPAPGDIREATGCRTGLKKPPEWAPISSSLFPISQKDPSTGKGGRVFSLIYPIDHLSESEAKIHLLSKDAATAHNVVLIHFLCNFLHSFLLQAELHPLGLQYHLLD